jgi:hypothetical protein
MQPITIFRGTSGLNTVADPARIPMTKSGINDVAEIVNMRIDQYGRPSRRPGLTLLESGSFHSLFCDGGDCFVVQTRTSDDAIMRVASDGSLTGVASGFAHNRRMDWAQYGDKTYFCNGVDNGVIEGGAASPLELGEYYGPDTNREFSKIENIQHIEVHAGRLFVSTGPILFWSEVYRFDLFDMAASFVQFHTDIRMIKSVDGGVYVSSGRNSYFLSGLNPGGFTSRRVASFPAVEWSDAAEKVDGVDIGFDPGLCALWASPEGAILGTPGGSIINLTKSKIIYPENVTRGFGALVGYEFIHGME